MERWSGKTAVVTGASSGCGAAIAEALVNNGMQVVAVARRQDRLLQLSNKLKGRSGKLHPFQCDITKESDILKVFEWVKNNYGAVHVLVNNAGIARPSGLINGNSKDWLDVLSTNVLGLSIATKLAVKDMINNQVDGQIIHINSVLGHYVAQVPNLNVYPASKFAVTALTETLRQELNAIKSKIRITSVSPGPVDSEFQIATYVTSNDEWQKFFNNLPKLQSEDVADAVVYVLSTPAHVLVHELTIRPVGEPV
ncbi:hypothetical protein RN001_010284 [Aquatica leii]|uniref:Farnesol dehydrogenase n=1 Tax=Aquatica leii TaxID=1421715 RepID=A0AAN7P7P3_9COLE|nr:hypothetical protein RN001_010284 [Aquatica leii]